MDKNVKIAKELIRIAKNLVAADDFVIKKIVKRFIRSMMNEAMDDIMDGNGKFKRISQDKLGSKMIEIGWKIEEKMLSPMKDFFNKNNLFEETTLKTINEDYSNNYDIIYDEFGQNIVSQVKIELEKEGMVS